MTIMKPGKSLRKIFFYIDIPSKFVLDIFCPEN